MTLCTTRRHCSESQAPNKISKRTDAKVPSAYTALYRNTSNWFSVLASDQGDSSSSDHESDHEI
jgi:hypothetical protein